MKTKLFKPALLSIAVSTALWSGHSIAQEQAAAKEPAKNDIEVIAVKGIRGSLIRSQAENKLIVPIPILRVYSDKATLV